jgi:hypothetical protein
MSEMPGLRSFLDRPPASGFEQREIAVAPGAERPYDRADWRDALVVLERGEIELEWAGGGRLRCRRGAVLCLVSRPPRTLRNRGSEPALLVAVSRRGW